MKKLLISSLISLFVVVAMPFAEADATDAEIVAIYQGLVEAEATAEDIILALVDAGMSLDEATVFAITQSTTAGFAAALANAGVCLANDQWFAQEVGNAAIAAAADQAKNAVEAQVIESTKNYGADGCQGVITDVEGTIPPFGKATISGGGVSTNQ